MARVLITGANRGIGLGLASRFLAEGHQVWATCRNPDGAREIWELGRDFGAACHMLELDVTSDESVQHAARVIGEEGLDILINNAGIFPDRAGNAETVDLNDMVKAFAVNAAAPLRVIRTFLPVMARTTEPKHVLITSRMGSIADNTSGGYYAYRMSKAALNMLGKTLAVDYPALVTTLLHPGWVKTDMGGSSAPLTVTEATASMYRVITGLKPADSGKFYDYTGKPLPW